MTTNISLPYCVHEVIPPTKSKFHYLHESSPERFVKYFLQLFCSETNIILGKPSSTHSSQFEFLQTHEGNPKLEDLDKARGLILIRSSGTTSQCKYIVHDKQNLVSSAKLYSNQLSHNLFPKISSEAVFPYSMMPSYMASIFNCILTPVVLGNKITLTNISKSFNQLQILLSSVLVENMDTVVTVSPFTLACFYDLACSRKEEIHSIQGMKHIISTSEKLDDSLMQKVAQLSPNLRVYDVYGITDLGGSFAFREQHSKHFTLRTDTYIQNNQPMTSTPALGTIDLDLESQMIPLENFSSGDLTRVNGSTKMELIGRSAEVIVINGERYFSSDIERTIQCIPSINRAMVDYGQGILSISAVLSKNNTPSIEDVSLNIAQILAKKHSLHIPLSDIHVSLVDRLNETISGKIVRFTNA